MTHSNGARQAFPSIPLSVSSINRSRDAQPPAGFRLGFISLLAAGVGLLAGVVAYVLYRLIGLFTNLFFFHRWSDQFVSVRFHHLGPWVIVTPVIGGIIIGFMAKYGSSRIKGHGIPEAMEAVLVNRSRIEPRVAILKPISAAIAIGTGGPFGAEGPIIQTGGALGSLVGQVLHTTAAERKVLLACGAAAGMSATFNTPIAGVILAIELLLFEFKSRSFIPLVIASTLATAVHMRLLGVGPMFTVAPMDFGVPHALPFYLALGVLCGLTAVGFSRLLYWVEDQFEKLPVDELWWPAIGALGLGVIGYFVPRVLGVGYDTIGDILNAQLPLKLLLIVCLAKAAALVISLGSGTSGGLLAPMFMSSAAMGGAFALITNQLWPAAHLSPAACALVAMGAVFGAASRATFSFIIFAFEITRDYNAVLPLMLVSVLADGVAMWLMPRSSIMTEKLARRGLRIHQDYEVDVLQQLAVADVMDPAAPTIAGATPVAELAMRWVRHDPEIDHADALFVVDDDRALQGVITRRDVRRAMRDYVGVEAPAVVPDQVPGDISQSEAPATALDHDSDAFGRSTAPAAVQQAQSPRSGAASVFDAATRDLVVAYPDESLSEAVAKMMAYDIGRLPVVARADPAKLLGVVSRHSLLAARARRHAEEHIRETGWWRGLGRSIPQPPAV
jgi:H+/Cl- antiporter ClcA